MTSYSHSRLSTFERCRFQYRLRYIDRVKVEFSTIESRAWQRYHRESNISFEP
jgi:hypothetical protein